MSVKEDIEIASSNEDKKEIKNSTKVIQYNQDNFENKKEGYDIGNSAARSQQIQGNNAEKVRIPTEGEITKKRRIKIISFVVALITIIIIVGIVLAIYFSNRNKKNDKKDIPTDEISQNELIKSGEGDGTGENESNNNEKNNPIKKPENEVLTKEEAMKAFIPSFNISSKEDSLTQLSSKSKKTYITSSNGIESSYSIISNAKYDIYTLNSTSSGEDKDFYSKKYMTAITINSLCTKLSSSSSENDCELKKYLDLNIKSTNNLRGIDEASIEKVKEVILPICLIEHTDTNIILSVTCPETLASNLKNDIILAFQTVKPDSANSIVLTENSAGTKTEVKGDKIYINSFDNDCYDYDGDPDKTMTCKLVRNIVTDKEGNLITSEKISESETVLDEKNKYSNNFYYNFEDISKQNTEEFNPDNYKANLNTIFELTKNLMKKETYISDGKFDEILEFIMKDDDNSSENNIRNLKEEDLEPTGICEETVFQKTIYNINLTMDFQNDIGLGELENAKAATNFKTGDKSQPLSHNEVNTKLEEILNKFIALSKSGNKLASELLEKLNDPLLELRDIINEEITELNELLAFKELSAIFDSTYAIDNLQKLPSTFIAASENLFKALDDLNIDVPYLIDNMKQKLKEDVSTFLTDSHEMLYNIFKNLTEVTNSLSSTKSKIAEISSYYLNDTDTSYVDIIQQAKEIMDNYYINEKNLIEPLVDEMLNNFVKNAIFDNLKNIQESLELVVEKIDNGELQITLASNDDYKNVIKNIYNANNKVNEIITNVQTKFKESINLQSNGYFETQKEINNNKQSYGQISERAMNISYTLDNNELIDKIFDRIMVYFRDQFIELLKYMDKSKLEQFPLKEDVLSTSSFPSTYINQIDNDIQAEKTKILNFIKDENKEYLDLINEQINSAKTESGNSLGQIIDNIQIELSDLNLDNLDQKYNEILISTKNSINSVIETNNNYAVEYLTNVKNAKSTHRTAKLVNTYTSYINSLSQIRSFIQNNLKNNLVSKYKTIITQIRANLQTIKSNEIIKKYLNQLPFAENHLRIVDNLYERFEKHISDSKFNEKYLTTINDFVTSTLNNLAQIEQNLKSLYNSQSSLTYSSSSSYDYYKYETYSYRCCKFKLGRCWRHTTCYANHYVGYTVTGSKNHANLKSINMEQNTLALDNYYNSLYFTFNNYIVSYNNALLQLNEPLEQIKQNIINKNNNNNYLNGLSEKINTIINEKLGNNLLNSAYNYYKNELTQKMPSELNNILEQWKNTYDEVYEYLNTNISNIKSPISEFSTFSAFYLNIYSQNISYDYFNSVVNKVKNDFNYTIKYYYNTILSKVNKTYSYILNNIPTNEKPFDEILNLRISQIKQSYNGLINQIFASENTVLQRQHQLNTLEVNEEDFFFVNSFIIDNIQNINQQLVAKVGQYALLSNQNPKEDSEELVVARYYLENAQNGKQIKEIYDQISKATFIDLQNNVYQQLIDKTWEIEKDELIKNIKTSLINSNENILNNFKYEKEKYINILQSKIYQEYYSKEDLEKEINTIYSNGLKSINENSKNVIYGYLNEVLAKVKSHISNEAKRLTDQLTSYSKNYNVIINRLNNYKTSIYSQFYNTVLSVTNDFYSNVTKKFYTDYIEKYLGDYQTYANEMDFTEYSFLNISLNLKEIINKNIEILINEYKELAKNQIDYLNKKKIQELTQLFVFSDIQNTINTEIDNSYTQVLEPVLKNVAIYNSGDDQVSEYDFSDNILNDINQLIEQKISQTSEIIKEMKGNNYLEENYKSPPSFALVKIMEFQNIKNSFDNFTRAFGNQELKSFKNLVLENLKNNFKIIIDNFVPSFGKDFFDRILNFNEIQKIKSLYSNLKYSMTMSLIYYIALCKLKSSSIQLPLDIKLKILTLNNLDETVKTKNNQVISFLNSKMDQFFEETKNYIVEKYINEMKNDVNIGLKFSTNVKTIIEQSLDGNRNIFENEYLNMMNNIIKTPFIEQYTKRIQKETNEMNHFIEKTKEEGRDELNQIFTLNSDNILLDIENKLNDTLKSVQLYNNHFTSTFMISYDIQKYLDNFSKDIIFKKYEDIKDILDAATKNLIRENLKKHSEEFEKEYSIEVFENKTKEINQSLSIHFDDMNKTLKKYGTSDKEYELNLEKEIANYKRIRRLEDTDDEKILYNQQSADYMMDKTIQELKNSSTNIKEFIDSFTLFTNFDEKLNKYISDINYQNGISEEIIKKNKENYDELSMKLYQLKSHSLNYYYKANSTYYELKDFIFNKINLINELIEKCSEITYKTISNKYIFYKDEFNPVNKQIVGEKESVVVDKFSHKAGEDLSYNVETKVEKFLVDNEFILDVLLEGDLKKPKVIGKVINKNRPKTFQIKFYSQSGQICGKIGRQITVGFNNITLSSDIVFNSGLNKAKIESNFNNEEYNIQTKFYEEIEHTEVIIIAGIKFEMPSICQLVTLETPENEKSLEIISSKQNNEVKEYAY